MRRILIGAMVLLLGIGIGYSYARYNPEVQFDLGIVGVLPTTTNFGCESPAYASIFTTIDDKAVKVFGGRGTDTAAIKVDREKQQVTMVTGAGIKLGAAQGETYPIIRDDEKTMVAAHVSPMGAVDALVMQKKTGLVMWTKTYDSLVLGGQAVFLKCR